MNRHPYLRAYMAGVLLPSWFLLVILTGYVAGYFSGHISPRLASAIIFPMAVVPNLWGLWNVLYRRFGLRGRISLGAFGSLLPLILGPAGYGLAKILNVSFYSAVQAAILLPLMMGLYFLAWKYAVAYFNSVVGD